MTEAHRGQEAIEYYRQQCDALGARSLRLQSELRAARRDAYRQRAIAVIIQRLYRLDGQSPSEHTTDQRLGENLVALLIESLQVDCAALLSRTTNGSLVVEHALGLNAAFEMLPKEPLPPQAISSAPEQVAPEVREAIEAQGLQRWLWSASAEGNKVLLLGHRHQQPPGAELAFESGDQAIAEAVLAVYLALTEERSAKRALRSAEINFRTLFESAQDAFAIVDGRSSRLIEANSHAQGLLGASFDEMQQQPLDSWLADPDPAIWRRRWRRTLAGRTEQFECQLRNRSGVPVWVELRLVRIDTLGRGRLLLIGRDIDKRKEAEAQLRRYAFRDELTQLPNRALMYRRMEEALERKRREPGYRFALFFLDIDRFKTVNDSLGHSLGDQLLVLIGERLRAQIHENDTIARLGGDEFLILARIFHKKGRTSFNPLI